MHVAIKSENPDRILKVNHSGEFGAVNIYRAQILIAKCYGTNFSKMLTELLQHEIEHLKIFEDELKRRNIPRCKSFYLCGVGGYLLGLISALLGKNSILSCTYAVESVVISHLEKQLVYLEASGDNRAFDAVNKILEDEKSHMHMGEQANKECVFYRPYTYIISRCTEAVIWLGMRL